LKVSLSPTESLPSQGGLDSAIPGSVENQPGQRPDWAALAATAVTIAVHLTLTATTEGPHIAFIGGACIFWAGFMIVRVRQDRRVLRQWGFRSDNLLVSTSLAAVLFAVAAALLAVYAGFEGTLRFPLHTLLLLILYPVWGIFQQFLALGIVVGNLERLRWLGQRKTLLVLFGAALFGLVHAYDVRLGVGTFFLELVTIALFLRYRNLWPLGILHGWLGGLFYLWVLNQDLWAETFR
jgi:hypothetical protein